MFNNKTSLKVVVHPYSGIQLHFIQGIEKFIDMKKQMIY